MTERKHRLAGGHSALSSGLSAVPQAKHQRVEARDAHDTAVGGRGRAPFNGSECARAGAGVQGLACSALEADGGGD